MADNNPAVKEAPVPNNNPGELPTQQEVVPVAPTEGKPLPDANPNGMPAPAGAP